MTKRVLNALNKIAGLPPELRAKFDALGFNGVDIQPKFVETVEWHFDDHKDNSTNTEMINRLKKVSPNDWRRLADMAIALRKAGMVK